jgi:hypothetical protein
MRNPQTNISVQLTVTMAPSQSPYRISCQGVLLEGRMALVLARAPEIIIGDEAETRKKDDS